MRKVEINDKYYIHRGVDSVKDQSYFLWGLKQDVLEKIIFPLGGYKKQEVRDLLTSEGFDLIAQRRESMSLCFMQGGGYREYVSKNIALKYGDVVDKAGNIVGRHEGCQLYTIGQKRGFEIFNTQSYQINDQSYEISAVDVKLNRLIVTQSKADLYVVSFNVGNYSIVDHNEFYNTQELSVVVRGLGRNPKGFCSVKKETNTIKVTLTDPAWALAKGQSAVFYIGGRVVGGGEIC